MQAQGPRYREQNHIREQPEDEGTPDNVPLLLRAFTAVLSIDSFPDDARNENDDQLEKENIQGSESPRLLLFATISRQSRQVKSSFPDADFVRNKQHQTAKFGVGAGERC